MRIRIFPRLDIKAPDGTVYLRRWTLLNLRVVKVMLHKMERPDYARQLHDHPWSFATLVLRGGYIEQYQTPQGLAWRHNRPGRVRFNRAEHAHVVFALPRGTCWTLVVRGPRRRAWGFLTDCGWMPFQRYIDKAYAGLPICEEEDAGRWEVKLSPDGEMVHVRWSIPNERGEYLWVRHYPATPWGLNACEGEARRFNDERRQPWEFRAHA